ncbi:TetR/AcrR family transcriptional regulator, partial [Kitasatospora sp. NPDC047058]|uniref:TetR/AcrR family transcriptional regulator n=1 Tax=Kitasatospora sp. NPDC047058 TaxID=3155620 RepID=UPI0033E1280A
MPDTVHPSADTPTVPGALFGALPGALRAPQQQRSREKVTRILAATARLLEERPYDEVGTKLIAAEARVSVGVLYRFFPDKHAIVTALVVEWLDRFVGIARQALAPPLPADPRELVARVLREEADFRREQPGFRRLWYDGPPLPRLREYDEATDLAVAELIRKVLVGAGTPRRRLVRPRCLPRSAPAAPFGFGGCSAG